MRAAGADGRQTDAESLARVTDGCRRSQRRASYLEHELKRRSLAIQTNRLLIEALLSDDDEVAWT